jgi:hypothetical protein
MATGYTLFVITLVLALLFRAVIWLVWNLEIVRSRRQLTLLKLSAVALTFLFLCPALMMILFDLLKRTGLVTVTSR